MSASPFRSHLLQQWARTSQGRAPAAVVPWLKPSSPSSHPQRDLIDREEEEQRRHHTQHHHVLDPPSISTLDSAASTTTFAPASSSISSAVWARPSRSQSRGGSSHTTGSNSVIVTAKMPGRVVLHRDEEQRRNIASGRRRSVHSTTSSSSQQQRYDDIKQENNTDDSSELAGAFQSLLQNRRTASRLKSVGSSLDGHFSDDDQEEQQEKILLPALDRAVQCAQMAPNHKRTEPFSFRRFLAGSEAARQLANISYQVTLRKTDSHPNAESKRQKWLQIPAFLVTLVHDNQSNIDAATATSETGNIDNDPFQALPYMPPETDKQLEDYAAASAAVQNVLLSLHAEGIGSKWATGPVIRTAAFRELVKASPTDRVVALIMVGGSTEFSSGREAQITAARRRRRRSIHGDLMVDLA